MPPRAVEAVTRPSRRPRRQRVPVLSSRCRATDRPRRAPRAATGSTARRRRSRARQRERRLSQRDDASWRAHHRLQLALDAVGRAGVPRVAVEVMLVDRDRRAGLVEGAARRCSATCTVKPAAEPASAGSVVLAAQLRAAQRLVDAPFDARRAPRSRRASRAGRAPGRPAAWSTARRSSRRAGRARRAGRSPRRARSRASARPARRAHGELSTCTWCSSVSRSPPRREREAQRDDAARAERRRRSRSAQLSTCRRAARRCGRSARRAAPRRRSIGCAAWIA